MIDFGKIEKAGVGTAGRGARAAAGGRTSVAWCISFLGMHPTFTHVPPAFIRSLSCVRPQLVTAHQARAAAAGGPSARRRARES